MIRTPFADPWFSSLSASLQHELSERSTPCQFRSGEFVFRRGQSADGLYGLTTGRLKVSTLHDDGREAVLGVLEPGNWFGEASCIDAQPRSHDVVAIEDSRALLLALSHFNWLMQSNEFARAISMLLCMHTRAVYSLLEGTMLYSTRARIARRLHRLATGDASTSAYARRSIKITQAALAAMLGITRQTLALELKVMVDQGALSLRYGHIQIESLVELEKLERGG